MRSMLGRHFDLGRQEDGRSQSCVELALKHLRIKNHQGCAACLGDILTLDGKRMGAANPLQSLLLNTWD